MATQPPAASFARVQYPPPEGPSMTTTSTPNTAETPADLPELYTVTITWTMSTGQTYTSVETRDAEELRKTREMARGMGRDYLTRMIRTGDGDVYLNPNHIVSTTIHVADYWPQSSPSDSGSES